MCPHSPPLPLRKTSCYFCLMDQVKDEKMLATEFKEQIKALLHSISFELRHGGNLEKARRLRELAAALDLTITAYEKLC